MISVNDFKMYSLIFLLGFIVVGLVALGILSWLGACLSYFSDREYEGYSLLWRTLLSAMIMPVIAVTVLRVGYKIFIWAWA